MGAMWSNEERQDQKYIMIKSGQVIVGLVENKATEKRMKRHAFKNGKEELEGQMSYEPIPGKIRRGRQKTR